MSMGDAVRRAWVIACMGLLSGCGPIVAEAIREGDAGVGAGGAPAGSGGPASGPGSGTASTGLGPGEGEDEVCPQFCELYMTLDCGGDSGLPECIEACLDQHGYYGPCSPL